MSFNIYEQRYEIVDEDGRVLFTSTSGELLGDDRDVRYAVPLRRGTMLQAEVKGGSTIRLQVERVEHPCFIVPGFVCEPDLPDTRPEIGKLHVRRIP